MIKQGDWVVDKWHGQKVLVVAIDGDKFYLAREGATSLDNIYTNTKDKLEKVEEVRNE